MSNNYLVIGEDGYIKEKEISALRDKFLSREELQLNYSCYDPNNIEDISDSLTTLPFLSEKRVVLIKDAHGLSERSLKAIISYLDAPLASSVMILSSASSLKKNKHYHELIGRMTLINADPPGPVVIRKRILSFFAKEKKEISPEAVALITELKGDDTAGIKMELEKLAAFSGDERIEKEHVEQLVGRSVTDTVFKLVDAINSSKGKWAFQILEDLYDQKKQPQEILGYLFWYIKVIQKILNLSGQGMSVDEIAANIKYSRGYTGRLLSQAKMYKKGKAAEWIDLLFQADRDIKTGRKPAALAIEMLLVSLLSVGSR